MNSRLNLRMEAVPWLLVAQAGGALAFLLLAVVGASARIAQLVARLILLGLQASLLVQLQPVVMRRDSKDSGLWRLLFVAIALWMVAVAHELASLLLGGELPPVPALAHLMLVAGLIAATTGVSLYPVSEGQDIGRLRDLLDVVLLLIGSLSLFWMAVVRPVIDAGIGSPITIVWLALPAAFDLALGLLLFRLVLLGGARPERIMLGMLMMAFVLRVPSDVAQAYSNLLADLAASPIWLTGWTLTPLIMAAAAKFRGGSPMPRSGLEPWSGQGRIAARIEPMLPVVVTTIIAGFTMAEWWLTGSADGFGLTTTGLLMLLLVGRQGVIAGQAEMRRHAALIQAAADFAFVCDLTGRLVLTNPAMKGAIDLGDPREGPTYLQDLMPEATADLALERAIAGGWSGEVVIQGRAGRLPVALSLRPLVDERQTEPMVAGTAHDLTELKKREADLEHALTEVAHAREELQGLNASLESKVESRTTELAESIARLEKMNEELKELDKLKSEFVTLVSHELRGPLTNIRSGVELALRRAGGVPGTVEETLQLVSSETERLTAFVEIILDLSALEAGRFPMELERTPLPAVARAVVSRIPPEIGGDRIHLEMDEELPAVRADERSLMSVLSHLLDNAIKYAPSGPVVLAADVDAGLLRISVVDEGPGIPPEALESVFEQFQRLDTRDSRDIYGHGLGLHLSRRLVEAMDGRIKARESGNGGAEIVFWLPLWEG